MQPIHAPFPMTRFRRNRRTAALRALTQEVTLTAGDLIWPLFVRDGSGQREPVASMPGVERVSLDLLLRVADRAAEWTPPT